MRPIATLHLLATAGLAIAGGPGGPSKIPSAPAGPDKLDLCGCSPITNKMAECQSVKGVNDNIRDCVCIPNDQPDSWYGHIHNCGACLNYDNDDDAAEDFFGNLGSTISQLFVSCTVNGGGVVSDGRSICASNAMFEACAALNSGRDSWSSFERDGETSNATYFVNIDAALQGGDETEISSSPSSSITPRSTASGSSLPTGAETTSPVQTGTSTPATSTPTSTTSSSAILTVHSDSRMAGIIALLAALTVGAVWP
ncbi:hypothetical protein V8F20_008566 [Naviculisporaceae sp. PSN 640]